MNGLASTPCRGSIISADCFGAAVRSIMPSVRSYTRRLTQSEADRDDLVQDTLMRAWSARQRFEPGTNLKAWLFRIARNCFLSGLKRNRRTVHWDDAHDRMLIFGASQEDGLYKRDLDHALAVIPPAQREALLVIVQDGLSYEAGAARLGVELGTFKGRVARARASVMRFLSGENVVPLPTISNAVSEQPPPRITYRRWKEAGLNMIG